MNQERGIRRSIAVGYWQTIEGLANWAARPEAIKPPASEVQTSRSRRWLVCAGAGTGLLAAGGTAAVTLMQHLEWNRDWTDPSIVPTPTLGPGEQILALPRMFSRITESQVRMDRFGPSDVADYDGIRFFNGTDFLYLRYNKQALAAWYRHPPLRLQRLVEIQRFMAFMPQNTYDEETTRRVKIEIMGLAVRYDQRTHVPSERFYFAHLSVGYVLELLKQQFGPYPVASISREKFQETLERHINQILLVNLREVESSSAPYHPDTPEQKKLQIALDFIDRVPNPKTDLPIRVDFIDHELLARSVAKA